MMLRGALLLAVLAAVGAGGAGGAVEGEGKCRSWFAGEDVVECKLPGDVQLTINAKTGDYAVMTCGGSGVSSLGCGALPRLSLGDNRTMSSVTLKQCPGAVARCAAGALGAGRGGARVLRLEEVPDVGALADEAGWSGLDELESLDLYWFDTPTPASPPLPVPAATLTSLPQLRNLSIIGARLLLHNDSFLDTRLQYLELASDLISSLPRGVFLPLGNLTTLNMWRNNLDNLTADALQGLSSLERLSLDMNPLTSLAGVFQHTPRLRELSLKSTSLLNISESSFSGLLHLEKLYISHTRRRLVVLPRALSSLAALHTLVVARCDVTRLPADLLAGSEALTRLDVSHNQLTTLPANLLRSQSKLEHVDLSYNLLSELPGELLWPLGQLRVLKLDHNRLTNLPRRMLKNAGKITELSVSNNMLLSLSGALRDATSLSTLDLSFNKLTLEPDQTEPSSYSNLESELNSLLQLQTVNLSHNRLRAVPDDLTILMVRLHTVDMSHNNLTTLTSFDLRFVSNNVTLDLQYNNISRVNLDPTLSSPSTSPYRGKVLLDQNPFTCDCHFYRLLSRLKGATPLLPELALKVGDASCSAPTDLYQRPLKDLRPEELICDLKQECAPGCHCILRPATKGMELSCNDLPDKYPELDSYKGYAAIDLRLRNVPLTLTSLPSSIRSLDLSSLNITTSPTKVPQNITSIDLSNNLLESPPLELLATNITVKLSGNPLACDCWHRSEMIQLKEYKHLVPDFSQLRCGAAALNEISATTLCDTTFAAAIGGTLALFGLLVAVVAVLLIRYSLVFKVFLYSRGWCAWWVTEKHTDDNKKYDAFISFAHQDADFVLKELMPRLESNNFKLCSHHRDWIAGESIQTQIARSVDLSRRTIIVLSRNFLDSHWAGVEFRTAHTTALRERRSRIIVLLIDDVSGHKVLDDELKELKTYLATNTYLRHGEAMFWDKLVYALPHRADEDEYRKRGEEIALRMSVDKLVERHVARPDVLVDKLGDKLCDKFGDKLGDKFGGLDARLNRDGKIVNTPALTAAGV